MINFITNELVKITNTKNIKLNEPMSKHTSFKVGGPADIMVLPENENELKNVLKLLNNHNFPYCIIGNGSNLLVRDKGIRGAVIKISSHFNNLTIDGTKIIAEAGTLLPVIAQRALKNNLKGFEFAAGIPGTLGGAIRMNAGAHGGEMKDIVTSVKVMDFNGNIKTLSNSEMEFEYRNSVLARENYIVLSVEMELSNGNYDDIKSKMDELKKKRVDTQPLNLPSAGSTFKRVEGVSVGKILQDMGLKGLSLNGAQVSEKHGGFIVNNGDNTKSTDILNLIDVVKSIVKTKHNIDLEEEVRVIGEI